MKTQNPLSEIERIAVAGAMGKVDEFKKALTTGTVEGSVVLKIDYSVVKFDDTDATPTSNILSENILARAVVAMGAIGDNFLIALRNAALEAYAQEKPVGDQVLEGDARVIAQLAKIRTEVTGRLPRTKKSGSTKVTATITKVTSGAVQEES